MLRLKLGMNSENGTHRLPGTRTQYRRDFARPDFGHEWIEYGETFSEQVVERLRGATIVISNKLPLRGRTVAIAGTEVNRHLRRPESRQHRSKLLPQSRHRRQQHAQLPVNSVPEHVLMMILALRRNLLAYREDVRNGKWNLSKQFCLLTHPLHDINKSTLGIIGYGAIGKAMARLGKSIGMHVLISEHKNAQTIREGRTSFEETLRQSDVVSLHVR
jgi:glycerate dehydrogenase